MALTTLDRHALNGLRATGSEPLGSQSVSQLVSQSVRSCLSNGKQSGVRRPSARRRHGLGAVRAQLSCRSQYRVLPPQELAVLTTAEFCCGPSDRQIWQIDVPRFPSDTASPAPFHPTAAVRNQFARCHCYSNDVAGFPLVSDIWLGGVASCLLPVVGGRVCCWRSLERTIQTNAVVKPSVNQVVSVQ
jgi:hypothetical protein